MATTMMSPREHRQVALDFSRPRTRSSGAEFVLQGAEKLWGAAAHAVMAAAQQRGSASREPQIARKMPRSNWRQKLKTLPSNTYS